MKPIMNNNSTEQVQYKRVDTVLKLRKSLENTYMAFRDKIGHEDIKPINISFSPEDQSTINKILISGHPYAMPYYAGGSLCLDLIINGKEDVLILNLDETYRLFSGGTRNLLSIDNTIRLFDYYKIVKGETSHFKESLSKASIRHIYDIYKRNDKETIKRNN